MVRCLSIKSIDMSWGDNDFCEVTITGYCGQDLSPQKIQKVLDKADNMLVENVNLESRIYELEAELLELRESCNCTG